MTQANDNDNGKAVLLLGHGSKRKEANDTLKQIASAIEAASGLGGNTPFGCVYPAYLQMAKPDFQEAVDNLHEKGFTDIIVMPYFLYSGLHVTSDLPGEIEKARQRYADMSFSVAESLGFHERLVDIAIERISELNVLKVNKDSATMPAAITQHPIEKESFDIIGRELGVTGFFPLELPIVKRVIHTSADFEFKDTMRFSPGAIEAGIEAIRKGCNIITDVRMVEAGITRTSSFGNKLFCFSSDRDAATTAEKENITKTAASMRKAASLMDGGIVAVGNAPTALAEVIRLIKNGAARPALVVGIPVGFVGAVEAKRELLNSSVPYITNTGRKGGSTVAAAIVNALFILAVAGLRKTADAV